MRYLATHENKARGTFDFPIEFHYVDPAHPRYWMPFHWHMESELLQVLSGTFTLSLDTVACELGAGEAAFIPEGAIHGGTPHDCVYKCLVFDFSRFLRENAVGPKPQRETLAATMQQPHFFVGVDAACPLIASLLEVMEREQRGYEFVTVGMLWQLMGLLVQRTDHVPDPLPARDKLTGQMKQVLRRIRRDYAEPLSLGDLSAEAGMEPKYFCRVFRQITGRTPIDYLNYYRVECAGERLCVTADSITDVAYSCGFNDLSYFSRTFRKYKGLSAQKYRSAQH